MPFMIDQYLNALIGGALIGFAVTVLLLFNGRITGISGIINGALYLPKGDTLWRLFFVIGLIAGGFIFYQFSPEAFSIQTDRNDYLIALAGFIVGFGTIMGNGCTSGHGVCGISRFSIRSVVATLSFISSGILTVFIMKLFLGS